MKYLIYILLLLSLWACGNDNREAESSNSDNTEEVSNKRTPEEKQITLQEVEGEEAIDTISGDSYDSETETQIVAGNTEEKNEKKHKKEYIDPEAKKILESPVEIYNPIDDPDPTPDPSPSEFVLVDKEPVLLNWEELKKKIKKPEGVNAKGTVYLKVLISKKGFYRGHVIRKSPHPKLSMAVVEQVKKIKAIPAKKDGKPVKVWVNLSYEFK